MCLVRFTARLSMPHLKRWSEAPELAGIPALRRNATLAARGSDSHGLIVLPHQPNLTDVHPATIAAQAWCAGKREFQLAVGRGRLWNFEL